MLYQATAAAYANRSHFGFLDEEKRERGKSSKRVLIRVKEKTGKRCN